MPCESTKRQPSFSGPGPFYTTFVAYMVLVVFYRNLVASFYAHSLVAKLLMPPVFLGYDFVRNVSFLDVSSSSDTHLLLILDLYLLLMWCHPLMRYLLSYPLWLDSNRF